MVEAWIQKEEEIQKVSNTRGVQSAPPYHVVQFEESKMNDVEALEAIILSDGSYTTAKKLICMNHTQRKTILLRQLKC